MVAVSQQLLAKDGAKFHAHIDRGGHNGRVSLVTQVRLGDRSYPEQSQYVTNEATARQLAQQFAEEQGFDSPTWDE
jgi:hypothetical protein